MTRTTQDGCPYCRGLHAGICPLIKAQEFYPNGTLKRIEFHEMVSTSDIITAFNQLKRGITGAI